MANIVVKNDDGLDDIKLISVSLDDQSLEALKKIGNGDISLGIRESVRRLRESLDMAPFSFERHKNRGL